MLEGSSDSFLDSLRDAACEPANDSGVIKLLARAKNILGGIQSQSHAEPVLAAGHEILREIIRSGMGVIYLGRHPLLKDLRAIKRPILTGEMNPAMVLARFRREVQAVGNLKHDHIIRAYDAGTDAEGPYLVMEYLDGASFSQLIARHGPLSVPVACELIRQAALGLQASHKGNLVHRDIKPGNLMLARANSGARVVIIDWGLVTLTRVRLPEEEQVWKELTDSHGAMGTTDYMPPEQINAARSVDIRADIYSLGATFYFLLAGKAPFQDRPLIQKMIGHECEAFPPLSDLRSDVPHEVLSIIAKMSAKKSDDRYLTPGDVIKALQPFCGTTDSGCLLSLLEPTSPGPTPWPPSTPTPHADEMENLPDPTPAGMGPDKKTASNSWKTRVRWLIATAVLVSFLTVGSLFGTTIIHFATNKGILVVDLNAPDIELIVKQNEAVVVDKTTKREFVLSAGEGEVEIYEKASGLKVKTKRFTITRAGKEIVAISLPKTADGGSIEKNLDADASEREIKIGSTVIVTANVTVSENEATNESLFVIKGTEGKVIAFDKQNKLYFVQFNELRGKPETWLPKDKLKSK